MIMNLISYKNGNQNNDFIFVLYKIRCVLMVSIVGDEKQNFDNILCKFNEGFD